MIKRSDKILKMRTVIYLIVIMLTVNNVSAQTNTGIGTIAPTNKLHVISAADPVRFEGLQTESGTTVGAVAIDATGVLKLKKLGSVSAARITGNITLASDNLYTFTDATAAPILTYDNLGEFTGHTFTVTQGGLYQIAFTARYNQRANTNDGGDGFLGGVRILAGTGPVPPVYGTVDLKKVSIPESGSPAVSVAVTKLELLKLTAGQLVQFQVCTYGATNNVTGNYTINISRVD